MHPDAAYPREGTVTFSPLRCGFEAVDAAYPREGTVTNATAFCKIEIRMQLIPARGRLPVAHGWSHGRKRCSLAPRGDGYERGIITVSQAAMQLSPARGRLPCCTVLNDVFGMMQLSPARGRLHATIQLHCHCLLMQLSPARGRLLWVIRPSNVELVEMQLIPARGRLLLVVVLSHAHPLDAAYPREGTVTVGACAVFATCHRCSLSPRGDGYS